VSFGHSFCKVLESVIIVFQVEHKCVAVFLIPRVSPNLLIHWLSSVNVHDPPGDLWHLILIKEYLPGYNEPIFFQDHISSFPVVQDGKVEQPMK
jgi:hypothetical protein